MLTLKKTEKPLCITTDGPDKGTIIYYEEKNFSRPTRPKIDTEIITEKGKFFPIPTTWSRQCIFVTGPSGVGKSYFVAKYAELYKMMFPKNSEYIVSNVEKDPILQKLNLERINIDEDLVNEPMNVEEVKDSLVIFDDVDTIKDKEIEKALLNFQADILQTGRHTNTYFINTRHLGMDYQKTRLVLSESTAYVLFPQGGNAHIMRTMLKTYAGLSKPQIDTILKQNSRWVYINKAFPLYVVTENKIFLL